MTGIYRKWLLQGKRLDHYYRGEVKEVVCHLRVLCCD